MTILQIVWLRIYHHPIATIYRCGACGAEFSPWNKGDEPVATDPLSCPSCNVWFDGISQHPENIDHECIPESCLLKAP